MVRITIITIMLLREGAFSICLVLVSVFPFMEGEP